MMAMLLAAGRGERMRPLTDHTPKPLLVAGGKPLIVWHIEKLSRAGITDLVINHAHLGTQIENTLGDGSRFGVRIRYSPEHPSALETAGGIAHALHLLGEEPFAVINGDIYCNYDFGHLPAHVAALQASNDTAHLVLINNPPHHPNGDFHLHEGRLISTNDQRLTTNGHGKGATPENETRYARFPLPNPLPEGEEANDSLREFHLNNSKLTFSGIGIYKPILFHHIPRGTAAPLAPLLRAQIAQGRVSGEHYSGYWMDVGTPQRLEELDKQLRASQNISHV